MEQGRVRLGVAYHPECFPRSEWRTDLDYMLEAGVDCVRLGEGAWSHLEPEEGKFNFDGFEKFIDMAGRDGISTILCVPTEASPIWLSAKQSTSMGPREYCPRCEAYRLACDRLVHAIGDRFSKNASIIAWHLDSGAPSNCECADCHVELHRWLETAYGNVNDMNRAWYSANCSVEVKRFDEVRLDDGRLWHSPQAQVAIRRFRRSAWLNAVEQRAASLQAFAGNVTLVLPLMVDRGGFDSSESPKTVTAFAFHEDSIPERARERESWVATLRPEQRFGFLESIKVPTTDGVLRANLLYHFLRGAGTFVFSNFRRHHGGRQMFNAACIGHNGRPTSIFDALADAGQFLQQNGELIFSNRPRRDVAVLLSSDDIALEDEFHNCINFGFTKDDMIGAMERRGAGIAFAHPGEDLSRFRLVVAPHTIRMTESIAANFRAFVEQGGALAGMNQFASVDASGLAHREDAPAFLQDVFGAALGDRLEGGFEGCFTPAWGREVLFCESAFPIEASEAAVLATFNNPRGANPAAATAHRFGNGKAILIGISQPDQSTLEILADRLLTEAAIPFHPPVADSIEVIPGTPLTGYFNRGTEPATVELPAAAEDLLTLRREKNWTLAPGEALVVRTDG